MIRAEYEGTDVAWERASQVAAVATAQPVKSSRWQGTDVAWERTCQVPAVATAQPVKSSRWRASSASREGQAVLFQLE
jgi:hypothetical protein